LICHRLTAEWEVNRDKYLDDKVYAVLWLALVNHDSSSDRYCTKTDLIHVSDSIHLHPESVPALYF